MSFLKDILRNAVRKGISKGIQDAVNSAAENNAKPREEADQTQAIHPLDQSCAPAAPAEELHTMWNEKVPGFPVWCFGGTDFRFEENGTAADGAIYYSFCAENTTQEGLDAYVALLKQNGFVRKYSSSDEILFKDLGGEYLVFGKTDAFGTAPVMMVSMVRTTDRSEIEC